MLHPLTDENKSVGLENCNDLFEKLKFEQKRLDESDYDRFDFWNFVVTASHLHYDWLEKDNLNKPKYANKKRNKSPKEMKLILEACRDISNASKHFYLDENAFNKKVITEVHPPEIRNYWSYFFNTPIAGVSINNTYVTLFEISGVVIGYLEWIFDDSNLSTELPEELRSIIDYIFKPA